MSAANAKNQTSEVDAVEGGEGAEVVIAPRITSASELTVHDKISAIAAGELGVYSTINATSFDGKIATFSALNDATPLSEQIGNVLPVTNIVMQAVQIGQTDGTVVDAIRTILVTEDGTAFSASSEGLYRSVQNILGLLGHPSTWPGPFYCSVVEKRSRNGFRFMTIVTAPAPSK